MRRPVQSSGTARTRSIRWNAIAGVGSIAANVVTFPLALAAAGANDYGAWLICFAGMSLLLQADLGLGSALVRDLSRTQEPGRVAEARLLERSGLSLFRSLSLVYPVLLAAALGTYFAFLDHDVSASYLVLCLSAASVVLAVSLIGRFFSSCLFARSRFDVERKATTAGLVLRVAGTATVVVAGGGPAAVVLVEAVTMLLSPLAVTVVGIRRFGVPMTVGGGPLVRRSLLRSSRGLFVSEVTGQAVLQLPLYFVGSLLSLRDAAVFAAGIRIFQSSRSVTYWVTGPALPPMSAAFARGDLPAVRKEYLTLFTVSAALGMVVGAPLVGASSEVLSVWLGMGGTDLARAFALMGIGIALSGMFASGVVVAVASGRGRILASWSVGWLAAELALMAPLASRWGATGAAFALLAPLAVLVPLQVAQISRLLQMRPSGATLRAFVLALAAVGGVLVAHVATRDLGSLPRLAVMAATVTVGLLVAAVTVQRRSAGVRGAAVRPGPA